MSMKRSKPRSSGRDLEQDDANDTFAKPKEPEKTWAEWMESAADAAFAPYALSSRYAKGQYLLHPKFGKGVVLLAEATRVEVLFEESAKKLGHATS